MFIIVSLFQLNQQTKKPAKGGEGIRRRGENPRKKGRERGEGGRGQSEVEIHVTIPTSI